MRRKRKRREKRISTHVTPYVKQAHFLPIKERIKFKACMIGFKIFNCQAPEYLIKDFSKFVPTSQMHLREGPGRDRFMFDVNFKESVNRVLSIEIKKQWNSIPLHIRKSPSIECFKSRLKTHFFIKSYNICAV